MGYAAEQQRRVRLELNNSGAWKTITRFDASDDHASGVVQEAAYQLAKLDIKSKWRICTDELHPIVLCYCTHDQGWVTT